MKNHLTQRTTGKFNPILTRAAGRAMQVVCMCLLAFSVLWTTKLSAQVSVSATAGTTGPTTYASIDLAFAAINAGTHQGAITVSLTASTSTSVTATLNASGAGSASYTSVNITPSTSGLVISSSVAGPTIAFNGASNVTIDGRPGGSGTLSTASLTGNNTTNLNIVNTNTGTAFAVEFTNDATSDIVRYCDLQGSNASNSSGLAGVVFFSSTAVATGNSSNTVDHCNIHAKSSNGLPGCAIHSLGKNSSVLNTNNTISNCNIYDYALAGGSAMGIMLDGYTSAWTISGNSMFQTASRAETSGQDHFMWIRPEATSTVGTGAGFTITGNYLGGSAPLCTGSAYTLTGTPRLFGIAIWTVNGATNVVTNNVIQNISISTNNSQGTGTTFGAIVLQDGNTNIGVPGNASSGNTIGDATSNTGSIVINESSGAQNFACAIAIYTEGNSAGFTNDVMNIYYNTIGDIKMTASSSDYNLFTGISIQGGGGGSGSTADIEYNTIGSSTAANSINLTATSTALSTDYLRGVDNQVGASDVISTIVNNNIIANLTNNNTDATSGSQVVGVTVSGTVAVQTSISGNVIKNLASATSGTGGGINSTVGGILFVSTAATACTISGNTIDSMYSSASSTSAGIIMEGIFFGGSTSVTNIISQNLVHSFNALAVNPSITMRAIDVNGGKAYVVNNEVRLGITTSGANITTPFNMIGILDEGTGNQYIYFNSVYIGGTGVGSTVTNTYAFERTVTTTDDVKNNIFVNNRSNASGGGAHYAVYLSSGTSGLTLNYNVYQYAGTGGDFGYTGSSLQAAYTNNWISTDGNSLPFDPVYTTPTGTSTTLNLDINSPSTPTPVEGTGTSSITALAGVTTVDFHNNVRSSYTPVDIGADAGNFTPYATCAAPSAPTSLSLTAISTSQINVGFTASSGGATGYIIVQYSSGSPTVTNPTNAASYIAGNVLGTGTVVYVGTGTSYSATGLFPGATYSYYVYAYNNTTCISGPIYSSSLNGSQATSSCGAPTIGSVTAGVTTIHVGASGYDITTIQGALNNIVTNGINTPTVIEIESNYVNELTSNQITIKNSVCYTPTNTLTIRPSSSANGVVITSSIAGPTISFNNAQYVTLDGRPGGTGSSITPTAAGSNNATNLNIKNTSTTGTAIKLDSISQNNLVEYCDVAGQNTNGANVPTTLSGVIYLAGYGESVTGGNSNNTIDHCNIHSIGTTVGTNMPTIGIYSNGQNVTTGVITTYNNNNTISNNNIYDYFSASNAAGLEVNYGANAWTISGNSFFQKSTPSSTAMTGYTRGIWLIPFRTSGNVGNGFTISGNYIGGSAPSCGGTAFTTTGTTGYLEGIRTEVQDGASPSPTVITNNKITNLSLTSTSASNDVLHGICTGATNGQVNIGTTAGTGNTIGLAKGYTAGTLGSTSGGITLVSPNPAMGVVISLTTPAIVNVKYDTVGDIVNTNTGSYFSGLFCGSTATVTYDHNVIGSTTVNPSISLTNTGANYIRGISCQSGGPILTITNNIVAGLNNSTTGTTSGTNQVVGIQILTGATASVPSITGNIVKNITCASASTGGGSQCAIGGITMASGAATACTISGNTIDSLVSTSASTSAAIIMEGIFFGGSASVTNTISGNFVHSFDATANNPSLSMRGIELNSGVNNLVNNMVRLGIKPSGASITNGVSIYGIIKGNPSNTKVYFNSVYIGGSSVTSGTVNTYAFDRTQTGTDDIRNNIFVNNRSNTSGTGINYAFVLNATTTATVNYNIYQYTGTGGVFGYNGASNVSVYNTGWVSGDVNSLALNPQFNNATGSASAIGASLPYGLDISTSTATPVPNGTSSITAIAGVTSVDIHGNTRSTPVDIGADAGSFTNISSCTTPSVITGLSLAGASTSSITGSFTGSGADGYMVVQYTGATPTVTAPTNGINYAVGGTLPTSGTILSIGTSTSISSTGLLPGTTYSYYIYAYSSNCTGGPLYSAAVSSSQATNSCGNPALGNSIAIGPSSLSTYQTANPGASYVYVYTSISSALTALSTSGINAPTTLELQSDYTSEVSSTTLTISNNTCFTPSAPLTIRPASTASSIVITSSVAGPTINLSGANYVTIDGRPGGIGSGITITAAGSNNTYLNIKNTSVTGNALEFSAGASNNTVQNVDFAGENTNSANVPSTASGVIYFANNGTNGDDYNTINYCNIHSIGTTYGTSSTSTLPTIGIYSLGPNVTTGVITTYNNNNTVSNCNIYDFFPNSTNTSGAVGLEVNYGNNAWTISGNSFFQKETATNATAITGYIRGIWLIPWRATGNVGNGFTVSGNYIGGQAPSCGSVGAPWTFTGSTDYMEPIRLEVGDGATPTPSAVTNNTITNLNITSTTASADVFHGICTGSSTGYINIGTTSGTGNTIGGGLPFGSYTSATLGSASGGITLVSPNPAMGVVLSEISPAVINVKYNTVGDIVNSNTGSYFSGLFCGQAITVTYDHNVIGSTTVNPSISLTNTGANYIRGISCQSGGPILTITNNIVAGLNNSTTGTTSGTNQVVGIQILTGATASVPSITGNIVKNITCASASTGGGSQCAIGGITMASTTGVACTISGNTIDSLVSTSASTTAAIIMEGIFFGGSASVTNTISGNFVHSFDYPNAVNPNVTMRGIELNAGVNNVVNNMVRLGINPAGASVTTPMGIYGIYKSGGSNMNIYFNTVYIGGSGVGITANNTYAFNRSGTTTDDVRDNIFVNNRSNSSTGGVHYSTSVSSTTGLTLNYNIYQYAGTGGVFGYNGTTNYLTYSTGWVSGDANSLAQNPQFINATGSASAIGSSLPYGLDISTSTATPVPNGTPSITIIAGVTSVDIHGNTRSTPVDIGADAGTFINLTGCTTPSAPTALTFPNVYISKINGSFTSSGADGYMVVQYAGSSPSVTNPSPGISYTVGTALGAGTVISIGGATTFSSTGLTINTAYSYYVYAYNTAACIGGPIYSTVLNGTQSTIACSGGSSGLIAIGPGAGSNGAPGTYTSYSIAYPTIAAAQVALGNTGISSATTLELQSNYTSEVSTGQLTIYNNVCYSNTSTLTIRPASGANGLTISSSVAGPTISFNNVQYVTLDGRPGGSGSSITPTAAGSSNATNLNIKNTSTTGTAIKLDSISQNNLVEYCDVAGQNTNGANVPTTLSGVIYLAGYGESVTGGNSNNTIDHCNIHSIGTTVGTNMPTIGIYSNGQNVTTGVITTYNNNNTISNNNIYDYFSASNAAGLEVNYGANAWTISGNSFFQKSTPSSTAMTGYTRGIWLIPFRTSGNVGNGFTISGNYIGGSAPSCGGTAFTTTGTTGYLEGIRTEVQDGASPSPTVITNNKITNLSLTSTSASNDVLHGICTGATNGQVNIGTTAGTGNTIGLAKGYTAGTLGSTSGGITLVSPNPAMGVVISLTTPAIVNVKYDTVGDIVNTNTGSYFSGLFCGSTATVTYDHNVIGSTTVNPSISLTNTGANFIRGISCQSGGPTILGITNNVIAGLNNSTTGTASSTNQAVGIQILSGATAAVSSISGNVIKNITCAAGNTGGGSTCAIGGILFASTAATACTISGNTIDSLVSTSASTSANIIMEGIFFGGSTATTNTISGNFVHSFDATANNPSLTMRGIELNAPVSNLVNNMVRLGIKPSGASITNGVSIYGIIKGNSSNTNVYFNSVYIGGSAVTSGAVNTYAFNRTSTGTDDIRNNIFVNNRSNTSGTGIHYAFVLNATTTATVNYNIYQYAGTGGDFASTNGGTTPIAAWSSGWISGDANSIAADPQYLNATGAASAVNLHINYNASSPADNAGLGIATIAGLPTTDIDGDTRANLVSSNAVADIGADAFANLTFSPVSPATICSGNTISALTSGVSVSPTYSWSPATGLSSSTVSNPTVTTSTLVTTTYTVTVTIPGQSTPEVSTGDVVTVNVPASVTTSPSNSIICSGSSTTFSISASGTTPTYQWQDSTTGGWNNITASSVFSGVTTATLSVTNPALTYSGYKFRCVVTGTAPCGSVTSGSASLKINSLPTAKFSPYTSLSICTGPTTLPIALTGAPPFALVYNDGNSNYTLTGVTANYSLNVNPLTTTTYHIRKVTDNNGCVASVIGSSVNLYADSSRKVILFAPKGGSVTPALSTVCSGSNQTFSITGDTGTHVQWQYSTSAVSSSTTWTNYGTLDSSSATLPNITGTTYVRAVVSTPGCVSVSSTDGEVTIDSSAVKVSISNITSTAATVNWTPALGATSYTIVYNGNTVVAGNVTSYNLTGLSSCTAYSVSVTSNTSNCGGARSGSGSFNTPTGNLTLTLTQGVTYKVTASWSAGVGPYKLYIGSIDNLNSLQVFNVTGTTYTTTNAWPGYTVAAYVVDLGSTCTPLAQSTLQQINVAGGNCTTGAPVITARASTANTFTVQWSGSSSNGYQFFYKNTNGSGSWYSYYTAGNSMTINGCAPGNCYAVYVQNVCSNSKGYTTAVDTICTAAVCTAPLNLLLSKATCNGFTATWNSVSGATAYQVYMTLTSASGSPITYSYTVKGSPYTVAIFGKGVAVSVYVKTQNCTGSNGMSAASNVESTTTLSVGCKDGGMEESNSGSMNAATADGTFNVYPNPNNGTFKVSMATLSTNSTGTLEVMDVLGRTLYTKEISNNNGTIVETIDMGNTISSGLYMVRVRCGNDSHIAKVQIQR